MRYRQLTSEQKAFLRAAELLDVHGWTQKCYRRSDNSICAYTALSIAAVPYLDGSLEAGVWYLNLFEKIKNVLKGRDLVNWNDEQGRTKEQAQALFREAANVQ